MFDSLPAARSLTAAEERELCRRIQAGDIEARNELVAVHLVRLSRLVETFANKNDQNKYDEVMSAAYTEMILAAKQFDAARGRFMSYVWTRVLRELVRQKNKQRAKAGALVDLRAASDVVGDTADTLHDAACRRDLRDLIDRGLSRLSERKRLMVRLAFGLDGGKPMTHEEIAAEIGVGRGVVGRELKAALIELGAGDVASAMREYW